MMGSLNKKEELFSGIKAFFVATGKLDEIDAKIYVLALKKGVVSSSDVSDEFPEIRSSTAIARLKSLANKGFLEYIPKETSRKRPCAIDFKAIHPKDALGEVLERTKLLPELLALYDEHWESLAENPKKDTETWLSKSEKEAARIGASILDAAKQEVKIYSHDCSWFKYIDVQSSLEAARSNGATINVIAHNPEETVARDLIKMKVSLFKCEKCFGPPFCIVDKSWLFLPIQSGSLQRQFSALRTNDEYLINNFLSLFETALSCSTSWGI
jgi:hypothetical protein